MYGFHMRVKVFGLHLYKPNRCCQHNKDKKILAKMLLFVADGSYDVSADRDRFEPINST